MNVEFCYFLLLCACLAYAQPKYAYFCDENRGICQPCPLNLCNRYATEIYATARQCILARKCTVVYTMPQQVIGTSSQENSDNRVELSAEKLVLETIPVLENLPQRGNAVREFEARRSTPRTPTVPPLPLIHIEKKPRGEGSSGAWRYYCHKRTCQLCELPRCPNANGLLFKTATECSEQLQCALPGQIAVTAREDIAGLSEEGRRDLIIEKLISGLKYLEERFQALARKVNGMMEIQQTLVDRTNYLLQNLPNRQPFQT